MPEVESLYQRFAAALRGAYGKLPIRGVPRITRFRAGQSRFTLTDPNGNSVIVVRHDESSEKQTEPKRDAPISRLGRAIRQAARFRDFKADDAAAAEALDEALAREDAGPPIDRARALLARAELALALGDPERARSARREALGLELGSEDRARLVGELRALAELERSEGGGASERG